MDFQFLDNPLSRWGMASGVAVLLMLTAMAARAFAVRKLAPIVQRTHTRIDDVALRMLGATYRLAVAAVALYAGSLVLELHPRVELILSRAAVTALLLQLALWGDRGVRIWRQVYHARAEAAADNAGNSSMTVVCFIARLMLWVIITLVILDNLGVNITALVASLGIGGIAVALAMQNILGDLFASLSIVLDKPFVVGDFIIVGDALGAVEFIGLKTTRLRGLGGEQIVFSNAELLRSRIHNHQRMQTRRVAFILRVTYSTSEEQLRAIPGIVREVVTAQASASFERAHFSAYAESSLNFEVVYHVQSPDYFVHMDTQQAIYLAIFSRFAAKGIAFAHPTRVVRLADAHEAADSKSQLDNTLRNVGSRAH
ncbi:mechanosensitive ion channel family protein [Massilia sp. CF038]|uniref:mechanosensitive ion channel family protein n=1 Tax=Massilia sp. CF038 TaxID=1881045 RepID=UPI0009238639|nr:mechanosensitive ion channel family protein [Massilia sp. CF038]SHG46989.1 Small-conductance mechanosensitive channel [Massilia sp. CF038]